MTEMLETQDLALQYAIDVVTAHLSNNQVEADDLPDFIRQIYSTIQTLDGSAAASYETPVPAVPIEESITHEYIVCLEDGKHLRMLKRYLMAQYGMTPADYRAKWGLPQDYPMAAPALTDQ
ncbi:MAG: hypothetical protein RLZZ136_1194, partial [Pseudomonadota bacterium]